MDALVEDDICILNHEKAHRRDPVTPVSIYSGDESVASHFALVTAYEDIKKRLKDSEKENSFLKKRIRILEEKLIGARKDEETSSVGREQVNKAYHAYREVCIDRDNLKNKLDKMNKDNSESLKVLNEQLQSKEVELLQLRTEVETQQVIRNLNPPSSNWEVEKLSCDLKIHGLEQELELLRKECRDLRIELQKAKQTDPSLDDNLNCRDLQRLSVSSTPSSWTRPPNETHTFDFIVGSFGFQNLLNDLIPIPPIKHPVERSAQLGKELNESLCSPSSGRAAAPLQPQGRSPSPAAGPQPPLQPQGRSPSPAAGPQPLSSGRAALCRCGARQCCRRRRPEAAQPRPAST
ncbi:5-azacytidine-induced protein 2 isoform X3 [Bubalus bubalis]|uniref:5-azacytidine-induced protein 2 isoform X3 n=1 Tax=Bubalus bubalis TaxID=89462 RepID=UPI001E1B8911|nr:5-azacytidine-induced protein 2 isoform X3 [Bubalus bubalis]